MFLYDDIQTHVEDRRVSFPPENWLHIFRPHFDTTVEDLAIDFKSIFSEREQTTRFRDLEMKNFVFRTRFMHKITSIVSQDDYIDVFSN